MTTVAALFVEKNGVYYDLPGVEPWDKDRDALTYEGPHPVVAHPPCERWGRYWGGAPTTWPRLNLGDDGACFKAALEACRRFGGVIEHPEGSHAWRAFHLNTPPRNGGWVVADWQGGWTCCVEQGHYGHPASKATWLYVHGFNPPGLIWGKANKRSFGAFEEAAMSPVERARAIKTGVCQLLSKKQRAATPTEFRDLLISLAKMASAKRSEADG